MNKKPLLFVADLCTSIPTGLQQQCQDGKRERLRVDDVHVSHRPPRERKQHMSTAALRNKKVNKVERLPDSAQVNPASSPLASGSASSSSPRPIISACGCGRPRPSAPTRLKPRLGAWKGRVCVCLVASAEMQPLSHFHLRKTLPHQTAGRSGRGGGGKKSMATRKVAEKTRGTDRQLIFFPCCSPPAHRPPRTRSIIFFGHRSFFLHISLCAFLNPQTRLAY